MPRETFNQMRAQGRLLVKSAKIVYHRLRSGVSDQKRGARRSRQFFGGTMTNRKSGQKPDENGPGEAMKSPEAASRREYLKNVRGQLLAKLGLPENTRPERVSQMLKLKAELEKLGKKGED